MSPIKNYPNSNRGDSINTLNDKVNFLSPEISTLGGVHRKISFNVQKEFCGECSLAPRRFIGKMDGVNSIDTENGKIVIDFDDSKVTEQYLLKISRESIEKLGYGLDD